MGGVFLYYNKVEISGVNTAKLKVLKESEKTELLRQMRSGDPTAREKLINGNLRGLVPGADFPAVLHALRRSYPGHIQLTGGE